MAERYIRFRILRLTQCSISESEGWSWPYSQGDRWESAAYSWRRKSLAIAAKSSSISYVIKSSRKRHSHPYGSGRKEESPLEFSSIKRHRCSRVMSRKLSGSRESSENGKSSSEGGREKGVRDFIGIYLLRMIKMNMSLLYHSRAGQSK